jgi:hypothetical protein
MRENVSWDPRGGDGQNPPLQFSDETLDKLVDEQLAWYVALGRPLRDEKIVNEALQTQVRWWGSGWKLRRFDTPDDVWARRVRPPRSGQRAAFVVWSDSFRWEYSCRWVGDCDDWDDDDYHFPDIDKQDGIGSSRHAKRGKPSGTGVRGGKSGWRKRQSMRSSIS